MARPPKLPKNEPLVPPSTFVAPSREELMEDVEGAIVQAFEARSEYVRQEANTVTLASLRRMLEKDLNVEGGFLETYKEFVTGLIKELLQGPEEQSPETLETGTVSDEHGKGKEKLTDEHGEGKEPEAEIEGNKDEVSEPKPKMKRLKKKTDREGIMKDEVMPQQVVDAVEDAELQSPSEVKRETERRISEAAYKRASHFKSQAETLTVKAVRHLLEQDLEFEKGALDAYKELVRTILDEIWNSENPENAENHEDSENHESPENEEAVQISSSKVKKRKAAVPESTDKPSKKKRKPANVEEIEKSVSIEGEGTPKKRKSNKSKKSKKKVVQEEDEDVSGEDGDDGEPKGRSSAEESEDEKPERKKVSKTKVVESKPAYGKKVEHLRSIIKDCGITVPPSVYKKAKQSGEARREGIMIVELETILRKEGLTASASRDEIKAVRKRKEKLKDLEGIDTSNIIEESRGRRSRTSANSFFAPQRNDPIDLGDEDEDEDEGEDEDGDDNSEGDPNVELQDDDDDED